jgi:hypothetical protein
MKRTRAKRLAAKSGTAKWTAWATRFRSRFQRHAGALSQALLLHVRSSRTSLMIEERWLHPTFHFRPQFYWQTGGSQVSHISQTFSRQTSFLNMARVVLRTGVPPETVLARSAPPPARVERTGTPIQMLNSTRHELATLLERRFLERRDSVSTQTTERLVHRLTRVERLGAIERTMTLRRDPVAAMKSVVEHISRPNAAALEQQGRRSFPAPLAPRGDMPAINVDQLADQVIRQIDRRVIARRERMGRT